MACTLSIRCDLSGISEMPGWTTRAAAPARLRQYTTHQFEAIEALAPHVLGQRLFDAAFGGRSLCLGFVDRRFGQLGDPISGCHCVHAWRTARGQPWRDVLLSLSRFWQIESLYRANAKYQPEWDPRFICFRSSADLPRIGIAALRAEAFIITPAWLHRLLRL
jgi:Phosphatidylglycerol lysyltransferase, C-terminal